MRKFLVCFVFSFVFLNSIYGQFEDLSETEIKAFEEEALDIQRRFLESIRAIITSENSDDVYLNKSYFLTLFFNTSSIIQDALKSPVVDNYPAFLYRDILSNIEMDSPAFNMEFKNQDSINTNKGRKHIFPDGSNSDYYVYKAKFYFIEKLIVSGLVNNNDNNIFNTYEKGILKQIVFDIFVNGEDERQLGISTVNMITKTDNGEHKGIKEEILANSQPWSSISESAIMENTDQGIPDLSIKEIAAIEDSTGIYLEAYPLGGKWAGKGIDANNGYFTPLDAYDAAKSGRQVLEITYTYRYDGEDISTTTEIILSEKLSSLIPEKSDELETIVKIDPNLIALDDLQEMGVSLESIKRISKYRNKCKRFNSYHALYKLLSTEDKLLINNKSYSYEDLKVELKNLLSIEKPYLYYFFDPNYIDSTQWVDMNLDAVSIEQISNHLDNGQKVQSLKKLLKIGCFCEYENQLRRWVRFNPENQNFPSNNMVDYIIPGLGHKKFAPISGNKSGGFLRTIFYGGGFVGSLSYATYHKIQSNKFYNLHIDAEKFRKSRLNLKQSNHHHKRFIVGSAVTVGFFVANIAHLKILELRNRRAFLQDDNPKVGYIETRFTNDGIGLVYNF